MGPRPLYLRLKRLPLLNQHRASAQTPAVRRIVGTFLTMKTPPYSHLSNQFLKIYLLFMSICMCDQKKVSDCLELEP